MLNRVRAPEASASGRAAPRAEPFLGAGDYYPTDTSSSDRIYNRFIQDPVSPPGEGMIGAFFRQIRDEHDRLGLRSHANYMFGAPCSTDDEDDDTIEVTRECFHVELVDSRDEEFNDEGDLDRPPRRDPRPADAPNMVVPVVHSRTSRQASMEHRTPL